MIRNTVLPLAAILLVALTVYPVATPQAVDAQSSCSWKLESGILNSSLVDVWGTSGNDVFTVGYAGSILHYDGSRWTQFDTSALTGQTLHGVWGSGPGDVYAVGFNSTIVHYNGSTWNPIPVSGITSADLYHIWGSSASNIFVVGTGGTILHYDGSAWTSTTPKPTTKILYGIWGLPAATFSW